MVPFGLIREWKNEGEKLLKIFSAWIPESATGVVVGKILTFLIKELLASLETPLV